MTGSKKKINVTEILHQEFYTNKKKRPNKDSYHQQITPGTCTTGIRVGCSSWSGHPKEQGKYIP
jgi:hypothetical protein